MMTGMLGMLDSLTAVLSFFIAEFISFYAECICGEGSFMGNKLREKLAQMNNVKRPVSMALEACCVYRDTLLMSS